MRQLQFTFEFGGKVYLLANGIWKTNLRRA